MHSRWQHDIDLKPSSNGRSRLSCREWNGAGLPIAPAHVVLIRCTSNIVARFDERQARAGGGQGSRRPRHLYISVVRGGGIVGCGLASARFRGAPQAPHPHQPRPESNVGPRPNQKIFKCRRRELNYARKGSDHGPWSPANPVQRCHRADDYPLSSSAKDGKVVVQERTERSEQHAQVSGWYSTKHGTYSTRLGGNRNASVRELATVRSY